MHEDADDGGRAGAGADGLLAERFEALRAGLRRVATGVLGSADEADDAVQETWLRLQRHGGADVEHLAAWTTTVVGRVCLDLLRRRAVRREEPLEPQRPDLPGGRAPDDEVELREQLGHALLVVLDVLTPPERVALVLHDVFAVPFDEVAAVLGRSDVATRKLASRARRRVQGAVAGTPDEARRREVVRAFLAAAREGDLPALLAVLHPDAVLRADGDVAELGGVRRVTGGPAVARALAGTARAAQTALLDGAPGAVFVRDGRLRGALELVVVGDRVLAVDVLSDPAVLEALDVVVLAT